MKGVFPFFGEEVKRQEVENRGGRILEICSCPLPVSVLSRSLFTRRKNEGRRRAEASENPGRHDTIGAGKRFG